VTIAKAKRLLGKKYTNLSDKEVESLIKKLSLFAETLVDATLERIDTIHVNETSNNSS